MIAGTFLYFAYGSNMLGARLKAPKRCPSACPRGVAELGGYEIHWHKKSTDGSAKCDIMPIGQPGTSVFGVLYEVANSEKPALDRAEGLGRGYDEAKIAVHHGGERLAARVYVATDTDSTLSPYTWYRALVVAGGKENGLPANYIQHLESVPAIEDPDRRRHHANMALIGEVRA